MGLASDVMLRPKGINVMCFFTENAFYSKASLNSYIFEGFSANFADPIQEVRKLFWNFGNVIS